MTKPYKKLEEEWVDIIREWHKDEPYPPIRPLAKRIIKALEDQKKEIVEKIKNAGPDLVCPMDANALEDQRKEMNELKDKLGDIVATNSDEFGTDYDAIAEELITLLYKLGWLGAVPKIK